MKRLRELARGQKPGTWCVILDADETIISNVQFQMELQAAGRGYSAAGWNEWCQRRQATALPGAKEFCALVKELGGKVIIITNRKHPPLRKATVQNLDALGIPYDACLLREGPYIQDRSKTMRRSAVEKGTVQTLGPNKKLPPLRILMRVGDQTHDLYEDKKLSFENVKDRFGTDLVIIPNPMYGSWTYSSSVIQTPVTPTRRPAPGSGVITWQEAMKKVGQEVVVEAKVLQVYIPSQGPAKLNFSQPWWKGLTVVVLNQEKFGDLEAKYLNRFVRVSGKVSAYTDNRGRKTIELRIDSPSQIRVVK
jgi:5'-nucleotidase (lipoprotein e(P4) family)